MCLSIAVHCSESVLAKGEHVGHEWMIVHNGMGHRCCGYVKVSPGHPWHGKDYYGVKASVHAGLTFSEPDEPCGLAPTGTEGVDDGHWFGFDCAYPGDAPDPELLDADGLERFGKFGRNGTICTQDYVIAECKSLCEQAKAATSANL